MKTRLLRGLALPIALVTLASAASAGTAGANPPMANGTLGVNQAFVIGNGNGNASLGGQVTFWGAQWWKDNALSGGPAPAAFKGFVDDPTVTCGADWNTDPGNSSHPPATIGPLVPAIVSSHITQTGSVISGDTTEVVLVQVDPGYAGNPGHPGTGTVIGILCGGILAG